MSSALSTITNQFQKSPYLLSSLIAVPLFAFAMPWFGGNKFPVKGRLVVITGGSQGMGKAVAILLAKKGANVAIIARDQRKLDLALEEIKVAAADPSTQKFLAVSADMTDHVEVKRAYDEINAWGGCPDVSWSIAGSSTPGYFKDMAPTQLENQIKTNYFSTMHCAHAALNLMTTAPNKPTYPRQLVFTSSVLGFYPLAGYTPYSPAKAAIRSLADSLRQECILYDINVACCFPATIYSPGFEQEQLLKPELTKILEGSDEGQTPEQVAEVCVRKLEEGQFLITTNFIGSLMRAASFAGSRRNNLLLDTFMAWVVNFVWWFVRPIMDMDVHKYRKTKGVPPPGSK